MSSFAKEIFDHPIQAASFDEVHSGETHDFFHLQPVTGFVAMGGAFLAFGFWIIGAAFAAVVGVIQQILA